MSRFGALVRTVVFLVVVPGAVAGWLPYFITAWRASTDWPQAQVLPFAATLIGAGFAVLLDSFWRFAWEGRGTPSPSHPTNELIVTGLYRHVRNPMYLAVLAIIGGQVFWFGHPGLALYMALVWLMFHAFITVYEEPTLRAQYRQAYLEYCAAVPRWLPRVRAWRA